MSDDQEDVMAGLIEESREHMEAIEPDFLEMEDSGADTSPDLINRIFRAMHSIKGGFGFFGKERIVKLAHTMENVLMRVRDGQASISSDMVEALLKGADTLRTMIDDVDASDSVEIDHHLVQLKPFTAEGEASASKETEADPQNHIPEACLELAKEKLANGDHLFTFYYDPMDDVEQIRNELASMGEVFHENGEEHFLVFSSVLDNDMMATLDLPEGVKIFETAELAEESPKVAVPEKKAETKTSKAPAKKSKSKPKTVDSIRVRTDLLSQLMDTTGELVLGRNRIMDIVAKSFVELPGVKDQVQSFEEVLVTSRDSLLNTLNGSCSNAGRSAIEKEYANIRKLVRELMDQKISETPGVGAIFQNFSQVSSDLQNKIMSTRLQPVGSVFSKFPRVIRDMNKKLGKEIELIIEGGDVELDKTVIEALGDPLTHLVRNSCDHGVETPEIREATGKPRGGKVKLIARHEGGQVQIIIKDDGAGINVGRVKSIAVKNNIMSQEEADALPDAEAFKLIFAAGFSTAEVVTDVSGRGVGMDVVRTNIEKLGGRIEIDSEGGVGSTLKLILPLTLAIIPSLGVTSAKHHYAIPQTVIEELVRVGSENALERIATIGGKPVLKLRKILLPLIRLSDVMGHTKDIKDEEGDNFDDRRIKIADRRSDELVGSSEAETKEKLDHLRENDRRSSQETMFIVVVSALGSRFGLIVDKLDEPQEVVVKPLSARLKGIQIYAGATIRSDGAVSMILDVDGIARDSNIRLNENSNPEETTKHALIREAQTMLEFKVGAEDRFAVNLSMVSRIEEINPEQLSKKGDQEFLRYEDSSLRVIRLHNHLNVDHPEKEPKQLFVLVPRLVPYPMGILIENPLGIFETDAKINTDQMSEQGIHGNMVIDGRMILFLDLYSLFEKVDPELHKVDLNETSICAGKKVLLAEDTALFRTVIGNFLRSLDFAKVDIVEDGALAWQKLQHETYDLLVTDIVMPEMDGIKLARTIRASQVQKDIPIVAVTSLMNSDDKRKILDAGINAYEQKLQKHSLSKAIHKLLQGEPVEA